VSLAASKCGKHWVTPDYVCYQLWPMISNYMYECREFMSFPLHRFGGALYHFGGLLNHSCNPNCIVLLRPDKIVVVTTRPVTQHEELTISYCACHKLPAFRERARQAITASVGRCLCFHATCVSRSYEQCVTDHLINKTNLRSAPLAVSIIIAYARLHHISDACYSTPTPPATAAIDSAAIAPASKSHAVDQSIAKPHAAKDGDVPSVAPKTDDGRRVVAASSADSSRVPDRSVVETGARLESAICAAMDRVTKAATSVKNMPVPSSQMDCDRYISVVEAIASVLRAARAASAVYSKLRSAVKQQSTTKDSTTQDSTTHESTTHESTTQDSTTQDSHDSSAVLDDVDESQTKLDNLLTELHRHVPPDSLRNALETNKIPNRNEAQAMEEEAAQTMVAHTNTAPVQQQLHGTSSSDGNKALAPAEDHSELAELVRARLWFRTVAPPDRLRLTRSAVLALYEYESQWLQFLGFDLMDRGWNAVAKDLELSIEQFQCRLADWLLVVLPSPLLLRDGEATLRLALFAYQLQRVTPTLRQELLDLVAGITYHRPYILNHIGAFSFSSPSESNPSEPNDVEPTPAAARASQLTLNVPD
jgi:hypothetical protein